MFILFAIVININYNIGLILYCIKYICDVNMGMSWITCVKKWIEFRVYKG